MQIHIIDAGTFHCDGGGIFGSVPKILWSKHITADERNLVRIPMRCLLVVEGDRKVLIETGAGEKLSEKYARNNGLDNTGKLIASLKNAGFAPEDITDVLHTHLHWDHCGGGTTITENGTIIPTFPNATYHVAQTQWENALNPNPREADAYFSDDLLPVQKAGLLNLVKEEQELFTGFEMRIFNGHTPGQIIPVIHIHGKKLAYVSDLIPTAANIPIKWIAAYDLYPVTSMQEKQDFLREAVDDNIILFFEHDHKYECATVYCDETKGPKLDKTGKLFDFI